LVKLLTFKEKMRHYRGKYFPERQLFLRSEGRVRFLTIGTNTQIVLSSALAVSLVWGVVTTYAYLTRDTLLEEKNQTISNMSADYQTLSSDFGSLELEVERRAKLLEARQQLLEKMVNGEENTPPPPSPVSDVDTDEAQTATGNDKTSLLQEMLGSKPANAAVPDTVERRRALLARLENTALRQTQLAEALLTNARDELLHIETSLADTKLTTDDLLEHLDGDTAAMGGPYLAAASISPIFSASDNVAFEKLVEERSRLEMVTLILDSFPVGKPAEKYYVSSKFGRRRDPLKKTWANHPGLDLAGWPGTAIYATAPGKVVHAGWFGPYGRMVEIEHGNGFRTRYGHMRKLRVKKGEEVTLGTRVGDMGKTGRVTGTHLHYEIWFDGKVRDPMPFLKAANDVLEIQGRNEKTSE
jgi:murein DD-endopeptidase MepM/ murein hydrolase activator NlpD